MSPLSWHAVNGWYNASSAIVGGSEDERAFLVG